MPDSRSDNSNSVKNVLLMEGDQKTAELIIRGLNQEGFAVCQAENRQTFLELAMTGMYSAAIIDDTEGDEDGASGSDWFCREQVRLPLIRLSAGKTSGDLPEAATPPKHELLMKPFSFSELVARLTQLIHQDNRLQDVSLLSLGEITMDLRKNRVVVNGKEIKLSPKAFKLLEYFLKNPGKVISQAMIMKHVWDYNAGPQTKIVETIVTRLTTKLKQCCHRNYIHTVKGMGYVCEARD